MKSFRWGLFLSVLGVVVLFSGCQMPFKIISRAQFDEFRTLERINSDQAARISFLIVDNEQLKGTVSALEMALRDKTDILKLMQEANARLKSELERGVEGIPALSEGPGKIIDTPEGVAIRVGSDVLFDTAQATLKPDGEAVLKEIAEIVRDKPNRIRVCGFTDSTWTGVSKWESNFQLSGARALTVLNFLAEQGIESGRMYFAGYGEHALIYSDDGAEDKKQSRRAEILLLNTLADAVAPVTPK